MEKRSREMEMTPFDNSTCRGFNMKDSIAAPQCCRSQNLNTELERSITVNYGADLFTGSFASDLKILNLTVENI
jgi:hypothetical protein